MNNYEADSENRTRLQLRRSHLFTSKNPPHLPNPPPMEHVEDVERLLT